LLKMRAMKKSFIFLSSLAFTFVFLETDRADACGGCFAPPPQQSESTVVTDHRMALSVSSQQTVLWDQIRYTGDPREFAWVLPVRAGAKVEVSNEEWFTALDASTQPVVYAPNRVGGRFGCGLTGCGESSSAAADSSGPGAGQVQILSQSVVGPYETVTLRATDDDALRSWLRSHGYAIPPSIEPTITEYVDEGFDFIALRLLPECGERAMRPVRVVTRGADPTLPLRMVAAGVGARVGLTLYVISEGRWETQNFPNATIATSRVRWDRVQNRSNYDLLSREAMEADDGRTWLTEYAQKPQLPAPGYSKWSGVTLNAPGRATPGLTDVFYGRCDAYTPRTPQRNGGTSSSAPSTPVTPCTRVADAGVATDAGDSGLDDGGATDAGETDAGDGGTRDAGTRADAGTRPPSYDPDVTCAYLDDLDVALTGLRTSDVWVTRLRAVLPANALSGGDLRLAAATRQTTVSNEHFAQYYADEDAPEDEERSSCVSAPKEHRSYGTWGFVVVAAVALVAAARRRRRR
jgi:hypothetical protein